jgi:hypothetical protein
LPDTASRPQLRPSEARERATPYIRVVLRTPMSFFRTAFPHRTSWKKQRYDFLAFCNRNCHKSVILYSNKWVDDIGGCPWQRLSCLGTVFLGIFASGIIWREFWRVRNFGLGISTALLLELASPSSGAGFWPRLGHHPIRTVIIFRLLAVGRREAHVESNHVLLCIISSSHWVSSCWIPSSAWLLSSPVQVQASIKLVLQ